MALRRFLLFACAVLIVACGPRTVSVELEPVPSTTTSIAAEATTPPPEVEVSWETTAFDLHGLVRLEASARVGVASTPDVYDDGEFAGPGRPTMWTDAGIPDPVDAILTADCSRLPTLLNRWADALYRLDIPEGEKAQADAYLGIGMERVEALGCDYEPDLEGRALPFP